MKTLYYTIQEYIGLLMELSFANIKKTASTLKETSQYISTISKKSEAVGPQVQETVEKTRVSAQNWNAYTLSTLKNSIPKSSQFTPAQEAVIKMLKLDGEKELEKLLSDFKGQEINSETLFGLFKLNKISKEEITKYIEEKSFGGSVEEALKQGIYTKEELIKNLASDVRAYSEIKSHPIFAPYNLSFSESAEVSDALRKSYIQTSDITAILRRKDSTLFETLGGEKSFDEVKGINVAYKSLQDLQKNIFGENVFIHKIDISKDIKELATPINGKVKTFICSTQLDKGKIKPPKIGHVELKTLIESNMLTKDLIDNPEFMSYIKENKEISKLLSTSKINYETPAGELVKIKTDFIKLADKANKQGVDSLSSNEIHSLTDGLASVFEYIHSNNPAFADKLIKSFEQKGENIYSVVQNMKSSLLNTSKAEINPKNGLLNIDGHEFKDHFFMRMIDRNLSNLTDNSSEKIFTLDEVVSMISSKVNRLPNEKAGNFNFGIDGVQGHGIKILGKYDGNKKIIDSIMQ